MFGEKILDSWERGPSVFAGLIILLLVPPPSTDIAVLLTVSPLQLALEPLVHDVRQYNKKSKTFLDSHLNASSLGAFELI